MLEHEQFSPELLEEEGYKCKNTIMETGLSTHIWPCHVGAHTSDLDQNRKKSSIILKNKSQSSPVGVRSGPVTLLMDTEQSDNLDQVKFEAQDSFRNFIQDSCKNK